MKGLVYLFDSRSNRRPAPREITDMLSRTMVCLQSRENQAFSLVDLQAELHHRFSPPDSTTAATVVHLDETFELDSVLFCRKGQVFYIARGIYTDDHPGQSGKTGKPADLAMVHHLVGNQHVVNSGEHQRLGLRHLLAADAAGAAMFDLIPGDIEGFVRLCVGAEAHPVCGGKLRHFLDISLEGIELDNQCGVEISLSSIPISAGTSNPTIRLECLLLRVVMFVDPAECGVSYRGDNLGQPRLLWN
jgi:hypothetical protein